MKIVVVTTHVPFVYGGAEVHAKQLCLALQNYGHKCEVVKIPFKWYPAEKILDHIFICRLLDLTESCGESIDMLIGLKFPAYYVKHPNKILWILHQHKSAYELWLHPEYGDLSIQPNGKLVREAIISADKKFIPEAKKVFANSKTVAERLKKFCGLDSIPLYHPPLYADKFYCGSQQGDYFFYPSRINKIKRQRLVIEALRYCKQPVKILFAGLPEAEVYLKELKKRAEELGVSKNIKWIGFISEEEKRKLYADSLGVIYVPYDEDYGYVTLEAMLAGKPTITCTDAGSPLEFVVDGITGFISEPTPQSLAEKLDMLYENKVKAKEMGKNAYLKYHEMKISWNNVVETLLK